jgi:Tol biopolymer transport system component
VESFVSCLSRRIRLPLWGTIAAGLIGCDSGTGVSEGDEECFHRDCVVDLLSEYDQPTWGLGDTLVVRRHPRGEGGSSLFEQWGLYLRTLDGSFERPLLLDAEHEMNTHSPAFSPDGRWVAFVDSRNHVYKVPTSGGPPVRLTSGTRPRSMPTWSPDGSQIAFGVAPGPNAERGLWVVGADGTGERMLSLPPEEERCPGCPPPQPPYPNGTETPWGANGPSWDPQEDALIYFADGVVRYDTATGSTRVLRSVSRSETVYDIAFSPTGHAIAVAMQTSSRYGVKLGVMPRDGGSIRWLVDGAGDPAWSPDGTRIAYVHTRWPYDGTPGVRDIWEVDVATGERRQVTFATGVQE